MLANPRNENSLSADSAPHTTHLRVTSEDAGERLDRYLVAQLPELSRTRIQELISEERVLVAGNPARASHRVAEGESVQIEVLSRPPLSAEAEDIPIELLYEDEDIVVVNKPAGMIVHSGAGQSRGTLVNALLHRLGTLSSTAGPIRPGIVHRLDRGTSGTLVVARNDAAHQSLSEQFGAREVEKVYVTLVHGQMEEASGSITLPVARGLSHYWRYSSTPDARIRYACTFRRSDIRLWATQCMARHGSRLCRARNFQSWDVLFCMPRDWDFCIRHPGSALRFVRRLIRRCEHICRRSQKWPARHKHPLTLL